MRLLKGIVLGVLLFAAALSVTAKVTAKPRPAKHKEITLPCWYGLFIPPKEGGRIVCGRMVYWI